MSSTTVKVPTTDIRVRDIFAILATIIAGGGLVYTAYMRGEAPSGNLAVAGFIAAAVLLFLGYGGGMFMDRLSEKHPILVKRYNHPLIFMTLSVLLTCVICWTWDKRDQMWSNLQKSGTVILHKVDRAMHEATHIDLIN